MTAATAVPFGPFLAISAWLLFLYADRQRPHQTAVGPQPIQAAVEMVLPASRFTACGSGNGKAV
jgi:hypothetical protein